MITITTHLQEALRNCLQDTAASGLIPIEAMRGYFCSREEIENTETLKQVFPVTVDGQRVFVYQEFA